ncbi:MAG: hypothetical protein A3B34_02710 [Candidatus Sungbacteria bacterium RIFCSPLOWO2_01_FULL_54_21]|uniref:CAAX prenyl protease 2/Lysostaphin resistance protein A-like domain-containing protein n=1 Tax=Candidatus Sungbacteria bacterium RIFCSPLOWO2_01_FULL_54_21 TaxID=1802279 RepID=A0A1G2L8C2_9BACT|nr:MAG: hypothetical protein A2679_00130 [Candidatus Sungbacteria bacterium RIFCSPHIGHO2_01_FULL_54_26]OHA07915.1 MAG: hypothetical protein A3B34_02710 [Candidatus Sungbacteria bacterium RIFCSPLOWO2_01_FULL_54_21]
MKNKSLYIFFGFGIAGAIAAVIFYPKAFPQSALRVEISHAEAEHRAVDYVESQGADIDAWKRATVFEVDDTGQIFLQRALGIPGFIRAVQDNAALEPWQYTTRFFRPLEKEEYFVGVNTSGAIVSFQHTQEDSLAGAALDKQAALKAAEKFLAEQQGIAIVDYEEKTYKDERKEKRTDHSFDFELKGSAMLWSQNPSASAGAQRVNVVVQGDRIGAFQKYIFVPEDFQRMQETADATGVLLVALAAILEVVLTGFAVFFLMRRYKAGDVRMRRVVWLTAAGAALLLISIASTPSGLLFGYLTTTPWASFLAISGILVLASVAIFVISSLIVGVPGESIAREYAPHANDLDPQRTYTRGYLASSITKGFLMASAMMGYISVFYYLGGTFFSIWSPITPEVSGYMASYLPFTIPLAVGMTAAISEEFTFRLFAIPLLKRYVRFTWLAVVIPAVVWAFLHSTYPVYPLYARGIELTIVGIALGYVFLKEGLLTALVAHFSFNAILLSLPLLSSGNMWLQFSGVAALLLTIALPFAYLLLTETPSGSTAQSDA